MGMPEYYIPPALDAALRLEEEFKVPQDVEIQKYLKLINALKMIDTLKLSERHYFQFLKLGLYIEEFKEHEILRKYDMFNVNISRLSPKKNKFEIIIPNMNPDDFIEADFIEGSKSKIVNACTYVFSIDAVRSDRIIVLADNKFCLNYDDAMRFDIKFRVHNYAFNCAHHALTKTHKSAYLRTYIFPAKNQVISASPATDDNVSWFNDSISSNPEQRQAVMNIVRKSSFPAPYILFGPPGTGKTATLVEAVSQVHRDQPNKILITAPSNAACDELTKRLLETVPPSDIYRIYSKSMEMSKIDKILYKCSNINSGESLEAKTDTVDFINKKTVSPSIDFINKDTVSSRRIIVATLCTCTRLSILRINQEYSHIFIDEAGQATEPQILIAISLIKNFSRTKTQVVLSGDPLQLRPVVKCKIAESVLRTSFLERLMREVPYTKCTTMNKYNPIYITKLLRNYRSHKHIITMPSKLFYEGELIPCKDSSSKKFPIIFDGVRGSEKKVPDCTSSYNDMEIQKVLKYVRKFVGQNSERSILTQEDIGVISPFALQCEKIQQKLRMNNFHRVTVGTVEVFQGQEKEVIIYSTVRTKIFSDNGRKHIGALSDPRRLNVALTRPKKHLVVIGSPAVLQTDPYWLWVLEFCRQNNSCQGIPLTPATLPSKYPIIDDGITLGESSKLFEGEKFLKIDDGSFKKPRNKNKPAKKALIARPNTLSTPALYQQDDANHDSREHSSWFNILNCNEEPITGYSYYDDVSNFGLDSITEKNLSKLKSMTLLERIAEHSGRETRMNATMNRDNSVTLANQASSTSCSQEQSNVAVTNALQPNTVNRRVRLPNQSPSTSYSQERSNVGVTNALQPSTVSSRVRLPNQSLSTNCSQERSNVGMTNALQPSTVSRTVRLPNQSPSTSYGQERSNVGVTNALQPSTLSSRVRLPNQSLSTNCSQERSNVGVTNALQPSTVSRTVRLPNQSPSTSYGQERSNVGVTNTLQPSTVSSRVILPNQFLSCSQKLPKLRLNLDLPEESQTTDWVLIQSQLDSKKNKNSCFKSIKKTVADACSIM